MMGKPEKGRARELTRPRATFTVYRDFALEREPERDREVRREREVLAFSSAFLLLKKR
jgi:hypothetical protein